MGRRRHLSQLPAVIAISVLAGRACQAAWPPAGEAVRVPVARDTWVSSVAGEDNANLGGASRLKTKSMQEFTLLDIDPRTLTGRVITGATLHLHCESKDLQRRLTVSTLSSDWVEGTAPGYQAQPGSACFNWASLDRQWWAYPGSDITAVINGIGNTLWRFAEASPPDERGWQVVAVEPAVVAARLAGLSLGFVVFDDVGSEYERQGEAFTYHQFPNRFVASREAGAARAPYFTVYLGPVDRDPPRSVGPVRGLKEKLRPGEALVSWETPADVGPAGTLGFCVRFSRDADFSWGAAAPIPRWLVPLAGKPGQPVTMPLRDLDLAPGATLTLGVRAVDAAGNLGPVSSARVTLSGPQPEVSLLDPGITAYDESGPLPPLGDLRVFVIDPLDKVHPVTGERIPPRSEAYLRANHLWSAGRKTVRLHAARNEFVAFQVVLRGHTPSVTVEVNWDEKGVAAPRSELLRLRHVMSKRGPLPDPLVPVASPLSIPAADESIAGQEYASVLVDVYVPHQARAGRHRGTLMLRSGNATLAIVLDLLVWNFTLPDYLSFIPEMNCYSLPSPPQELAYYRLAHRHRTCLNRLPYNWRGQVAEGCAPTVEGEVFRWESYDTRFGPLLEGSAFADLPRSKVPVDTFYLPLNENWPIPIEPNFNGSCWADEALSPAYRAGFVRSCRGFAEHARERKWRDTFLEFYLNGKVYYKEKGWSRCSAPWVFDEPTHTQDFWALRWYGIAFHQGVAFAEQGAKMAFRCDLSRPQWQRNLLDGVLDVNVAGGAFRRYLRGIQDRKRQWGEVTFNYASSNAIEDSNVQPVGWCLDTWSLGADGVLPWQTLGRKYSWQKADELSLFYPGEAIGSEGPLPSLRLKAYRQGQQAVEYLTLLCQVLGQPRWAVSRWVRATLGLVPEVEQKSADDAGRVSFTGLDPVDLWRLRMRIGARLDAAAPAPRRRLTDLRTPVRDPSSLPDLGYVTIAPPKARSS